MTLLQIFIAIITGTAKITSKGSASYCDTSRLCYSFMAPFVSGLSATFPLLCPVERTGRRNIIQWLCLCFLLLFLSVIFLSVCSFIFVYLCVSVYLFVIVVLMDIFLFLYCRILVIFIGNSHVIFILKQGLITITVEICNRNKRCCNTLVIIIIITQTFVVTLIITVLLLQFSSLSSSLASLSLLLL